MKKNIWINLQRIFPFMGLIVIILIFTIISGDKLWTKNNLLSIINTAIPICLGGAGMIFVATQGSTDMSMGSLLALAGTLGGLASIRTGLAGFITISLLVGLLCGIFNGYLLAYLKVESLMVTLAMLIALRAIVSFITNGQAVFVDSRIIGLNRIGIKLPVFLVLILAMWYIFTYTKIGFYSRCIGENQEVGRFSGINIRKYKILAFTLSGLMAGFVSIFTVGKIGGVSPNMGNFFELQVMTAMFVGGVPVTGGSESKYYKMITGALMLAFLQNGLTISLVSAEIAELIQGVILLVVVFLEIFVRNRFIQGELAKEV